MGDTHNLIFHCYTELTYPGSYFNYWINGKGLNVEYNETGFNNIPNLISKQMGNFWGKYAREDKPYKR